MIQFSPQITKAAKYKITLIKIQYFNNFTFFLQLRILIDLLKEKTANGDKAIVVSQWRTLLDTIALHLRRQEIQFQQLDGTIPVLKRQPIVDNINDPKHTSRVLLLSLTAGGVGLNLVGANHLFLLDLHWNPQLENQAQDRIYRMGQTKPIFVYK